MADQITGSILDAGCRTGGSALHFASRGEEVTGIDFLAEPITRAKKKAAGRDVTATILVMDALALKDLPEVFDSVIDSGLFHVFDNDDRRRYVEWLASVLKTGGRLFLMNASPRLSISGVSSPHGSIEAQPWHCTDKKVWARKPPCGGSPQVYRLESDAFFAPNRQLVRQVRFT